MIPRLMWTPIIPGESVIISENAVLIYMGKEQYVVRKFTKYSNAVELVGKRKETHHHNRHHVAHRFSDGIADLHVGLRHRHAE